MISARLQRLENHKPRALDSAYAQLAADATGQALDEEIDAGRLDRKKVNALLTRCRTIEQFTAGLPSCKTGG